MYNSPFFAIAGAMAMSVSAPVWGLNAVGPYMVQPNAINRISQKHTRRYKRQINKNRRKVKTNKHGKRYV